MLGTSGISMPSVVMSWEAGIFKRRVALWQSQSIEIAMIISSRTMVNEMRFARIDSSQNGDDADLDE